MMGGMCRFCLKSMPKVNWACNCAGAVAEQERLLRNEPPRPYYEAKRKDEPSIDWQARCADSQADLQVSALRIRDLLEGRKDLLARCERADRDRDHWKETEAQSYALYVQVRAELAAIKGRLEWRVTYKYTDERETAFHSPYVYICDSGAALRREFNSMTGGKELVSIQERYQAGPWEPSEPKAEVKGE